MFHFCSRCLARVYIQSRHFEWIIDSKAEFSYYTMTYRECNQKRGLVACLGSGKMPLLPSPLSLAVLGPCTWYYPVPAHDITLSLHMILPCPCTWYYPVPAHDITLSLRMILPCHCARYYPVPAQDITLSLCMILPCPWTYYPVPAYDITLSVCLVVKCFFAWLFRVWKYMRFKSWWRCLSLLISFRSQETRHPCWTVVKQTAVTGGPSSAIWPGTAALQRAKHIQIK